MSLTDEQILNHWNRASNIAPAGERRLAAGRAIESATAAPLRKRINELETLRSEELAHAIDMASTITELEKQLEAAKVDRALVRNEALEEAAVMCEMLFDLEDDSCNEAEKCAAAIRSMKSDVGNA